MTQYLPPNLLALFAPRDPIPYVPPLDKLPHEKKFTPYLGVSSFLSLFEDPKDTPPPTRVETKDEKRERKRKERQEQVAYQLEQDLALWDPSNDARIGGDPFKTLFVGRINYDTSESKLRREFEVYGPVKRMKVVFNTHQANKPRGFAFIEYEHERDMHSAYKHADGKKIDGRRVLVDVERGRTIKGWRPRRLGGGLGGTRKGGPEVNTKFSGREDSGVQRDDRSRSRDRGDRRRRSRSPRGERRPRRSRSPRDRKPRIDRDGRARSPREDRKPREDRDRKPRHEDGEDGPTVAFDGTEIKAERKRRRSRSRDRKGGEDRKGEDRKDRKDRSRSRERRRRSRSPRGDRKRRRSRDRDMVKVKEEKLDKMLPGEGPEYGMTNDTNGSAPTDENSAPPLPPTAEYGGEYGAAPAPVVGEYGDIPPPQ